MNILEKAIWQVDTHLRMPATLDAIAERAGVPSEAVQYARTTATSEFMELTSMEAPLNPKRADPRIEDRKTLMPDALSKTFPMKEMSSILSLWQQLSSEIFASLLGYRRP